MDIIFLENGKVQIFMKDYVIESIEVFESFGEEITKCSNTPAKKDFFNNDEEEYSKLLGGKKAEAFHYVVSKLQYVSKRARVDIELGL